MATDNKSKIQNRIRRTNGGQESRIDNYSSLPKSYKNAFPFKIGTTSYIFPDHIIPNVRAIGPHVDEIELLLFEGKPESLPTSREIKALHALSKAIDITFNIHLPLDIYLGNPNHTRRKKSIETIKTIYNLTALLKPTSHTLHLIYDGPMDDEEKKAIWKSHLYDSFDYLKSCGIRGESITIETLFYPLHWLDDLIDEFKLNICMDIGHLILRDIPLLEVFEPYREHITMLHLHGVENGKDHQPLTHLSESSWKALIHLLRSYQSAVSIEVFSYHHLRDSLEALDNKWNNYSEASNPKAPFYFKSQS